MAFSWKCDLGDGAVQLRIVGCWPDDEESAAIAVDLDVSRCWVPGVLLLLDLREADGQVPSFPTLMKQARAWFDRLGPPARVAILTPPGALQATANTLEVIFQASGAAAAVHLDGDTARAWLQRTSSV